MSKLAFIASPLDRNANNRTNIDFMNKRRADPLTKVIQLAGDAVRIQTHQLFTVNDASETEAVYLGEDNHGHSWYARQVERSDAFKPLRALMVENVLAPEMLSILAQARSVLHWHEAHGFCARCGSKTLMSDGGYRRHCQSCGADHFPRTDPVVIMAIRHGKKLLLGRQSSWPPGMYSALAGFMEPGETIEAAVRREVLEEAGIKVGAITYAASQPWPFPTSLMIGMIGEAETFEIIVDPVELEDARWFSVAEVETMMNGTHGENLTASHPYAIAHHLIKSALGLR